MVAAKTAGPRSPRQRRHEGLALGAVVVAALALAQGAAEFSRMSFPGITSFEVLQSALIGITAPGLTPVLFLVGALAIGVVSSGGRCDGTARRAIALGVALVGLAVAAAYLWNAAELAFQRGAYRLDDLPESRSRSATQWLVAGEYALVAAVLVAAAWFSLRWITEHRGGRP